MGTKAHSQWFVSANVSTTSHHSWEPTVQMHEPAGDILHSNHTAPLPALIPSWWLAQSLGAVSEKPLILEPENVGLLWLQMADTSQRF